MVKATVAALILDATQTRILLTRRLIPPFRGQWCLPGGHIDPFEAAEKAVRREVAEETGLTFAPQFMAYFDERLPDLGWHAVVLAFAGPGTGSLQREPGEVAELAWFTWAEALRMPLAFGHNDIVAAGAARWRQDG